MIETVVTYQGDLRCRAVHAGSGAVLTTAAPTDNGGRGDGFSPSELLSASLGSCILSIMAIAARASGVDIPGASATVTKTMADAPRRIAAIAVTVSIPGAFTPRQRAKLTAAAHACPVHNILAIDAPVTIDWTG